MIGTEDLIMHLATWAGYPREDFAESRCDQEGESGFRVPKDKRGGLQNGRAYSVEICIW